jgi:hypothetical protein
MTKVVARPMFQAVSFLAEVPRKGQIPRKKRQHEVIDHRGVKENEG